MPASSTLFCKQCSQYRHFVYHADRPITDKEAHTRIIGEFWRCSVCQWERQWGAHG